MERERGSEGESERRMGGGGYGRQSASSRRCDKVRMSMIIYNQQQESSGT